MAKDPGKKVEKKKKQSDSKENENIDNNKPEEKEKFVWVDDKGRKPIQYLMPIYIGIGAFLLIIWIFIYIFAIQPAWTDFEKSKEPGLDIEIMPSEVQTKNNH